MNEQWRKIVEAAEVAGQRFYLNLSSRFLGQQGGAKFGQNTGSSLEFMDHREYQPGDDVRHIDWNAMARHDRITVKLFREEITPHLDILLDSSVSMAPDSTDKAPGALAMAALLKTAALNSDYTIALWQIKDRFLRVEPDGEPVSRIKDAVFDYSGNVGQTIASYMPKFRANGVRILVSDLFWEQEPMSVLQKLADGAAMLIIIQTLGKFDINPPLSGNLRLVDCESGATMELVVNEETLQDYRMNFARHQQYWKKCCSKAGALFYSCLSDRLCENFVPAELMMAGILMARS